MLTSFKRIIKIGYKNFFRNIGLNVATVFVISIVVCLISFLFVFNFASNILLKNIQNKVDVSVYFKENASTEEILSIKSALSEIPEVENIDYTPKEQSLEEFTERHKEDAVIMESLAEIGINPFLASLSVRASDGAQYEKIVNFLEADSYQNIIEKVDYYQRKSVIDKVFSITSGINKGGISLSIILGLIAIVVAFNTVRIAICSSNEEISVMRLVGAQNLFIRGPFVVQGIIWGVFSALISLVFISIICYGLNSPVNDLASISIFNLFIANFWMLLLIQVVSGASIGVASSLIAVEKYLKV